MKLFSLYFATFVVLLTVLNGCGPAPRPGFQPAAMNHSNQTGGVTADGRPYTGAGPDGRLEELKRQEELRPTALSDSDRTLAEKIANARIEIVPAAKAGDPETYRVHVYFSDVGHVIFDFKPSDRVTAAGEKDVRYQVVKGKINGSDESTFELAMLCAPGGCRMATLALRDRNGAGAKAGLTIYNQDSTVYVPNRPGAIKSPQLKALSEHFATPQVRTLHSFAVAWGPSGFSLDLGESDVCPAGKLVETNDRPEAMNLKCPKRDAPYGIEGKLLGNTTRGELFLEFIAAMGPGAKAEPETAYMIIRRPRPVKTPAAPPSSASPPASGPKQAPTTAPSPTAEPEDEEEEESEEEPPFAPAPAPATPGQSNGSVVKVPPAPGGGAPRPRIPAPAAPPAKGLPGWIIPVNPDHAITKVWLRDRKRPLIDRLVKEHLNSKRMNAFAERFIPNRDLVLGKLAAQGVPAEFAMITYIESTFFIDDDYPIGVSSARAVGPWQFMPRTGTGNGLEVKPAKRVLDKHKKWVMATDPCDERADLDKSSEAAAKYLRKIIDMFPQDPRMVLLGYNQGEYGAAGSLRCLRSEECLRGKYNDPEARIAAVRELGLGFWTIYKFHMAPKESLNYVPKFIASHLAALESKKADNFAQVPAWKPNPQCAAPPATPPAVRSL